MFVSFRHVTQSSTNQVVTQISKDIARLTVLMRRGEKQQKLQIEKLTTDFKDALQRYSDMQKVCKMRYVSENLNSFNYKEILISKHAFCLTLMIIFLIVNC